MKITLTNVFSTNMKSDQITPLIGKNGKPYTRMSIRCQEYGDRWLSGFSNKGNAHWKQGDQVEIEVKEVTAQDGSGRKFLNFETVSGYKKLEERVTKLEDQVKRLSGEKIGNPDTPPGLEEIPVVNEDEPINPEDLPF